MNIIRIIYRRTEQFISTSMCAQEVNIEEQCAEHFLLQNDRSAEQSRTNSEHFRFTRKSATEQIQNLCHGVINF